nr:hypothetical protein [Tanacetum cinerariifolium]
IPDNSSNNSLLEEVDLFLSDNSIPPEPPDAETNTGEEIPVVMNDKDKFDKDYHSFIFVIFAKMFSLLSAESEDMIFDPEGDVRFLEELLIDNSIFSHESSDSNFEDNPSISRPPPEPPDDNFDLEPEVISAVMEDIDEPDEHFDPGREINVSTKIEDDDYFPFMIVIRFFLPYFIFPE